MVLSRPEGNRADDQRVRGCGTVYLETALLITHAAAGSPCDPERPSRIRPRCGIQHGRKIMYPFQWFTLGPCFRTRLSHPFCAPRPAKQYDAAPPARQATHAGTDSKTM